MKINLKFNRIYDLIHGGLNHGLWLENIEVFLSQDYIEQAWIAILVWRTQCFKYRILHSWTDPKAQILTILTFHFSFHLKNDIQMWF